MKRNLFKSTFLLLFSLVAVSAHSKGTFDLALSCDPDGAKAYLNGIEVVQSTPAIIQVSNDLIGKPIMIKFEKKGYTTKTITVSYDKKLAKKNPIVYCHLEKEVTQPVSNAYTSDPTIPAGQANARVDRDNPGKTDMERAIVRWYFDSDPRGARIFYRVISNVPNEVKNTNETYLTTTPLEETKSFNILGLTYDNSRNVTIEIKVSKRGFEDQIKRYNVRQALDQQEISGFFELVPKETEE
ncbi:MAG: hypothetical protein J1E38_03585 [Paramuribaculum sp.]|nr:hypothetical protein [Paramuribaculum sp.]